VELTGQIQVGFTLPGQFNVFGIIKELAGEAMHPQTEKFVRVGLLWGPKVRLVHIYLDT
jgi:hypothetical protein